MLGFVVRGFPMYIPPAGAHTRTQTEHTPNTHRTHTDASRAEIRFQRRKMDRSLVNVRACNEQED